MTTRQAWAAFTLLGLIWGSSFLLIRIAVQQLSPFEVVFFRTGIAAVGLLIVVYARGKRLPLDWDGLRPLILLGVGNTVIPFVLISWGETRVESGLASVLQGTAALFTLVVAHFAFADERITPKKLVGLALGFLGVVILASRSWEDGQVITGDLLGQLAIVGASFFYALGATYSRKVIQNRLEPIIVAAGAMLTSAVVTGAFVYLSPLFGGAAPTPLVTLETNVLFAALMLGLLNTFVAYLMFYSIVKALGAARTSMVTYVVPAVGLTLGAIFLGEVVDFRLLLGAALIVGGIGVVNLKWRAMLVRRQTAAQQA